MNEAFHITIFVQAKHGGLLDLVRQFGSEKELAKYLGVDACTLGGWVNLREFPRSRARLKLDEKLPSLGLSFDSLFPPYLFGQVRLKFERDVRTRKELVRELSLITDEMLKTLDPREEKCIRFRLGIGDEKARTLKEVGELFGVTRERVRQIELTALSKLCQAPKLTKLLAAN